MNGLVLSKHVEGLNSIVLLTPLGLSNVPSFMDGLKSISYFGFVRIVGAWSEEYCYHGSDQ